MLTDIIDNGIMELEEALIEEKSDIEEDIKNDEHASFDGADRQKYFDCYVPHDYVINTTGVWKAVKRRDTLSGKLEDSYERICETRLMQTGLYMDADSPTDIVELTFLGDYNLEKLYVPSVALVGIKEWKEHVRRNDNGRLDILDDEIKATQKFLKASKQANIREYKGPNGTMFKTGIASARVGWQGNKFEKFIIGSKAYTKNGVESAVFMDTKNVCVDERLAPKGILQGWLDSVRPVIEFHKLRFAMYYAIGSLLLGSNKSPNSVFMIIGDTSKGKTFTLMVMASMFGNPNPEGKSLIVGADTSVAAMNAILTTITDIPVFIDEIGRMKEETRNATIYAIGNGKESIRGKNDGGLRPDKMIRCNAIITGEISAINKFSNNGVGARTFACNERPIPMIDGRIVVRTKRGIIENYGHILPLVLNKMFALGEANITKLIDVALDRLYETTEDPIMRRKAEYFAVAEVGGMILEQVFAENGIKPMNQTAIVNEIWNDFVLGDPDTPLEIKALDDVNGWAASKPRNFLINDNQPAKDHPDDIYGWFVGKKNPAGYYTKEYEYLDLNKQALEDFLKKSGYNNIDRIFDYWRNHGITECSIDKKNGKICLDGTKRLLTYPVKHYYQCNQPAVRKPIIRIKMSKIKELLEFEEQEQESITEESNEIDW